MPLMTRRFASLLRIALVTSALAGFALGAAACTESTTSPPRDSSVDACRLGCAPPPPGCHLEGGDGCTTCGTLVCPDAALADAGGDDAGALDAGAAIVCTGPGTSTFPTFERACAGESDCVVVEHQVNCCGTLRALGIRADAQAAFDAAEASCRGMYPSCRCPAMVTRADDDTTFDGVNPAHALCTAGQCTSTFTPR
jgi:hypothetical protein